MNAEDLVSAFAATRPHAAALAEVVSFAVLVDRPLLRHLRVRLVPEADAGAEADLWLSPLIKSRSHDGITFTPEVGSVLRKRLASNPLRSNDAWQLTEELHAYLPPALKLEETINRLSIDESEQAAHEIDKLLSSVLAAMAAGGRDGLASWAARALENFPTSVRRRPVAQMLAAGASLRLGSDPRASLGADLPDWLRFVAPIQMEKTSVGVQLAPHLLRVDASSSPMEPLLRLPATRPLLLDVTWTAKDGHAEGRQLVVRPGDVQHLPVDADEVQLRTVAGDVYELRLGGTAPVEARPSIIDFSEVINRLGDRYVDEIGRVRDIAFAPSGHMTLVTGPPGAGKTSTLAEIVRQLARQGTFCVHHFFESGTPKLEYFDYAERSLIAQFMARYDLPSWALTMQLPEFLRTFASVVGTGPVYIVLDNIDVVPLEDVHLLLLRFPPQFRLIASATSGGLQIEASAVRRVALRPPTAKEMKLLGLETETWPGEAQSFGSLSHFARMSSPRDRVPTRLGRSIDRFVNALAVARAPLPLADANRLRASVDLSELNTPWSVERTHMGEPCIAMLNEYVRDIILAALDTGQKSEAHRQLAMAVSGDRLPPEERSWYGIRHGAWHWLQGGGSRTMQRLMPARELRRAIELFGARVTVDIIEEISNAGA